MTHEERAARYLDSEAAMHLDRAAPALAAEFAAVRREALEEAAETVAAYLAMVSSDASAPAGLQNAGRRWAAADIEGLLRALAADGEPGP
jgi:hypothetical protein